MAAQIPNNAATALERVFWQVRGSGCQSVKQVWIKVLKAQPDTAEFAIRHAEVVHLVRRLQLYLLALPEGDQTRNRYEGDVVIWYNAVVYTGNWDGNWQAHNSLISADKVNLLGSLGEILSYRAAQETPPDVDTLLASLADWAALLDETELPPDLAAKIRAQVEQIEFLLSEVETYGLEPLVEHGRTLFGLGLSVIKVAGTVGNLVGAMSNLFQFVSQVQVADFPSAAAALGGVFSSVNDVFTLASEEESQKAIQAKEQQKALTAKVVDESASEVIDGEVVNELDDEPQPGAADV